MAKLTRARNDVAQRQDAIHALVQVFSAADWRIIEAILEQLSHNPIPQKSMAPLLDQTVGTALATADGYNKKKKWFESEISKALGKPFKFDHATSHGTTGLVPQAAALRHIARRYGRFLRSCAPLAQDSLDEPLRILVSEGVESYLLKHVIPALPKVMREKCEPFIDEFHPDRIRDELVGHHAHLAVAWDGYGRDYPEHELRVDYWDETAVPVCALFAMDHPLALGFNPGHVTLRAEDLRHFPIIHPKLFQLQQIAQEINPNDSRQVINLLEVVSRVRGKAVGLFPGWRWVLARLEHDEGIRAAELLKPELPKKKKRPSYQMRLCALRLPPGEEVATAAVEHFCDTAQAVFSRLNSKSLWKAEHASAAAPILDLGSLRENSWYVYFITTGPDQDHPCYEWRTAEFTFSSSRDCREYIDENEQAHDGRCLVFKSDGGFSTRIWIDVICSLGRSLLVKATPGLQGPETDSFACFGTRITHPEVAGIQLLGRVLYHISTKPTSAPIILSNEQLGPQRWREIQNSNLACSLSHVDHIPADPLA